MKIKELIIIIITTLVIFAAWISTEASSYYESSFIPDELLEIALPFDVTIDVEYLQEM